MKQIVTITVNPSVDKSSTTNLVIPEEKLRCTKPTYDVGGGGVNVTRAIKKLGGNSIAIFSSGGKIGEFFKEMFHEENLSYIPIEIEELIRQNLTIYETSSGNQFRFNMPGPMLSDNECRKFLSVLEDNDLKPDYLVISGSLPEGIPSDFYVKLIVKAKALGSKVILDASGDALNLAVNEGVYLIKPNEKELKFLTNCTSCAEEDLILASKALIDKGKCEVVIASLGEKGALLVTKDISKKFIAPKVAVQSKVGAGDSMLGGIVYALSLGEDLISATILGLAAGTAAVMTPGTNLCKKEDVERLKREIESQLTIT